MGIAPEELVAAVAGESHLRVPGGQRRKVIGREGRAVGERLIQPRQDALHELDVEPGVAHLELPVLGAAVPCRRSCPSALVEPRVLETDGVGFQPPLREARRQTGHRAGINAPAQKGTYGNVADQVESHRLFQDVGNLRRRRLGQQRRAG